MKGKTVQPMKEERWWIYIISAVALFIILTFSNNGSYYTEKVVGWLGTVGVLCALLFADKQRVKPVSYTHLDVYKRQGQACTCAGRFYDGRTGG